MFDYYYPTSVLGIIQEGKQLASGKLSTKTKAMPDERRLYSVGKDKSLPALVAAAIPKFIF